MPLPVRRAQRNLRPFLFVLPGFVRRSVFNGVKTNGGFCIGMFPTSPMLPSSVRSET
jgi:hypothetical protein